MRSLSRSFQHNSGTFIFALAASPQQKGTMGKWKKAIDKNETGEDQLGIVVIDRRLRSDTPPSFCELSLADLAQWLLFAGRTPIVADHYVRILQSLAIWSILSIGLRIAADAAVSPKCIDTDMNCYFWAAKEPERCLSDENLIKYCKKTCQLCANTTDTQVPHEYDVRNAPESLHKLAFLVGRWRSDFHGKADFPTIPRFTYGEELDFSLSLDHKTPVLNYTAFAWDNSDLTDKTELHSESGFIAGKKNSSWVALNTVMSNGFLTVEEGNEKQYSIRLGLRRIGRINFSRDLPVRRMIREWTLLNETHLESRLLMGTTTHPKMLLHTSAIYRRIFP